MTKISLLFWAALQADAPAVLYSTPKLASVGFTEQKANDNDLDFRVNQDDVSGWIMSSSVNEKYSAYKVLISNTDDKIPGATLLGPKADEAINIFALAIRQGLTTDDLKQSLISFPSAGYEIRTMIN